eukprot:3255300-Pleurochrysis_carterae.AAC.1
MRNHMHSSANMVPKGTAPDEAYQGAAQRGRAIARGARCREEVRVADGSGADQAREDREERAEAAEGPGCDSQGRGQKAEPRCPRPHARGRRTPLQRRVSSEAPCALRDR